MIVQLVEICIQTDSITEAANQSIIRIQISFLYTKNDILEFKKMHLELQQNDVFGSKNSSFSFIVHA